jgi:hypothetical protein
VNFICKVYILPAASECFWTWFRVIRPIKYLASEWIKTGQAGRTNVITRFWDANSRQRKDLTFQNSDIKYLIQVWMIKPSVYILDPLAPRSSGRNFDSNWGPPRAHLLESWPKKISFADSNPLETLLGYRRIGFDYLKCFMKCAELDGLFKMTICLEEQKAP